MKHFFLARVVWGNNRPNFIKFCQLFLHESVVFMLFSTHFAVLSRNCLHSQGFSIPGMHLTHKVLFEVGLLVLQFKRDMFDKNRVTKSDFMCIY